MMLVEPVFRDKRGYVLLAGALCAALFTVIAVAAVVSPDPVGVDAGYLVVPVSLTADTADDVAGILFDLTFDPEAYEVVDVFSGDAADQAGKEVQFAAQGMGTVRVLITGFNQNTIETGTVARIYLKPLGAKQSNDIFEIENPLLSDPLGEPVDDALQEAHAGEAPPEEAQQPTNGAESPAADAGQSMKPIDNAAGESLSSGAFAGSGGLVSGGERGPARRGPERATRGQSGGHGIPRSGTNPALSRNTGPTAREARGGAINRKRYRPARPPYAPPGKEGGHTFAKTHLALNAVTTASRPDRAGGAIWFSETFPSPKREPASWAIALAAGLVSFFAIFGIRAFIFNRLPSRRRPR